MSEAKASHSHKMWTEVSSSVPHSLKSQCPLGPTKEPLYDTLFPQRVPASESLSGSQTGPLWREIPAYRAFLPLSKSLIFRSVSPVRELPPCSLTGSPWAAKLRHRSHWSTFHAFIPIFMNVCRSPQKEALLHTYGEKHKVTVHGAPRRRKDYMQWGAAWFPKGIVTTLLSLPQCRAAFGTIPSTFAWVDQSPVSQHVSWQSLSGCTLQNCYRLPRDPGWNRVRMCDTPRYGRGSGFMGGINTLSLYSSFSVRDQVSLPYKTTGKIIFIIILIVCSHPLAGSACSNPAEVMDGCLLGILFVVQVTGRSLFQRVLPSVCECVTV